MFYKSYIYMILKVLLGFHVALDASRMLTTET